MDLSTLTALGLSESQAKAYMALVKEGFLTPPELADKIGESRSNAYKIMDRLEELGLVSQVENRKKSTFRAANPVALDNLAKQQRNSALDYEKRVQTAMPTLLNYFNTFSEQPGIRFFQGKEGIKEIFNDMLRTRKDIYLVRSPSDVSFYDESFFETFRKKRAAAGIKTFALTPDLPSANHDPEIDIRNLFTRTWIGPDAYTASVEWDVYGTKLAVISYGEEAIGMIIESPMIAESFRQLFMLASAADGDTAGQSGS